MARSKTTTGWVAEEALRRAQLKLAYYKKVPDLRSALEDLEDDATGRKNELQERLLKHLVTQAKEDIIEERNKVPPAAAPAPAPARAPAPAPAASRRGKDLCVPRNGYEDDEDDEDDDYHHDHDDDDEDEDVDEEDESVDECEPEPALAVNDHCLPIDSQRFTKLLEMSRGDKYMHEIVRTKNSGSCGVCPYTQVHPLPPTRPSSPF